MGTFTKIVIYFVMVTIAGCGGTTLRVPAKTAITDTQIFASREEVFDAALVVSQHLSLNVGVLEKDSGLIRFDAALLTPFQLDEYCEYPYVNRAGQPLATFADVSARSEKGATGPVNGKVSLTILITDDPAGSNMNIRSIWSAHTAAQNVACNSTGVFEKDFVIEMKKYLSKDKADLI